MNTYKNFVFNPNPKHKCHWATLSLQNIHKCINERYEFIKLPTNTIKCKIVTNYQETVLEYEVAGEEGLLLRISGPIFCINLK